MMTSGVPIINRLAIEDADCRRCQKLAANYLRRAFREHLNKQDREHAQSVRDRQAAGANPLTLPTTKHRHGRFQQRTRKYGDYLYHQDRDKFEQDFKEWLAQPEPEDLLGVG